MVHAVSQTLFWLIALPVVVTLLGVVIGQLGPEFFRRRATAESRYDAAIVAVGKAFAARQASAWTFLQSGRGHLTMRPTRLPNTSCRRARGPVLGCECGGTIRTGFALPLITGSSKLLGSFVH